MNYDADDIKSAQKLAETYLDDLRDKKYEAVVDLVPQEYKAMFKASQMATYLDGRFHGEPVLGWEKKKAEIVPGPARQVHLIYTMHSASVALDFDFVAELATGPEHWQLIGINVINDAAATAHAEEAKIKAFEFVDAFRQRKYDAERNLFSAFAKKRNAPKDMPAKDKELTDHLGEIKGSDFTGSYDTTGTLTGERRPYTVIGVKLEGTKNTVVLFFTMIKTDNNWEIESIGANEPNTDEP